jgi:mannose-6-phosphate isomerase-like protein (cupin superfamily)
MANEADVPIPVSSRGASGPQATVFRYERPELGRAKAAQLLCRSDRLIGVVQVITAGGETNLHSHDNLDGFWFVLSGRARFYTTDDEVLAELGPNEGVLVPRHFPYWFESVGDDVLELLQVEASSRSEAGLEGFAEGRVNHTRRTEFAQELEAEFTSANAGRASATAAEDMRREKA